MGQQHPPGSRHLEALRKRVGDIRLVAPRVALAIESNDLVMTDEDGRLPQIDVELGEMASRAGRRLLAAVAAPLDTPLRLVAVRTGAPWFEEHPELGPLQPFWIVVSTVAPGKAEPPGARRQPADVPLLSGISPSPAPDPSRAIGGDYIRSIREHVGHDRVFYPWCGAAVRRGDRLLLVREQGTASWHCPGGGVEIGETPQQTIARELDEETGLAVASGRLVGCWTGRDRTYPNGDEVQFLSALFAGSAGAGLGRDDRTGEVDARGWFSERDLPPLRPPWDSHVRLAFRSTAAVLDSS